MRVQALWTDHSPVKPTPSRVLGEGRIDLLALNRHMSDSENG